MNDARSYTNGATEGAKRGERADIGTIVPDSSFARAVGRFETMGVSGFRASTLPNAPLRATRAEAEADEIAYRNGDYL